eukprot:409755_1
MSKQDIKLFKAAAKAVGMEKRMIHNFSKFIHYGKDAKNIKNLGFPAMKFLAEEFAKKPVATKEVSRFLFEKLLNNGSQRALKDIVFKNLLKNGSKKLAEKGGQKILKKGAKKIIKKGAKKIIKKCAKKIIKKGAKKMIKKGAQK